MKIFTDLEQPLGFPTSVAIGNFDGVHLGHRAVIRLLREKADSTKTCVLTFVPHPQRIISGENIPLIVPVEERMELLRQEGVDYTVCLNFTKKLSLLPAKEFVERILVGFLKVRNVVVGPSFNFGYKKSGNIKLLCEMGKHYGFHAIEAKPVKINGEIVSSSRIREYLSQGDVKRASLMLGYRYYIKGVVVEGEKRGRTIGYPTINLRTKWELFPKRGVYATWVHLNDGIYESITNIGYRPTFEEKELLIESHLFNFEGNAYNEKVRLEFVERIRDERKFESVDALVAQIKKDIERVKGILAKER